MKLLEESNPSWGRDRHKNFGFVIYEITLDGIITLTGGILLQIREEGRGVRVINIGGLDVVYILEDGLRETH